MTSNLQKPDLSKDTTEEFVVHTVEAAESESGRGALPTPSRERPILFSAPMVRALLSGRKTQTRRLVKRTALDWLDNAGFTPEFVASDENGLCPYGHTGDRLYVRETWKPHSLYDGLKPRDMPPSTIFYKADDRYAPSNTRWYPGIHQPRWASRLTLTITQVRIERLNAITEADALAEGTQEPSLVPLIGAAWSERDAYAKLWEHINGPGSWEANPWVWAVSFAVSRPASGADGQGPIAAQTADDASGMNQKPLSESPNA
jgi:hypothetical protein